MKNIILRKLYPIRAQFIAIFLILLGIAGVTYSLILYAQQPAPPRTSAGVTVSAPSSVKPPQSAVDSYTVAASLPKYIAISSIGIDKARVIRLGQLADGQITTPNNIYDTGWYEHSAKPGQPGAMFIFGHVSSWTADGIFYNLKKLQSGDKIVITRGDDKQFTYQVVSSKVYPYNKVDMHAVLSPISSKPGLNLMTCTGQIIKGTSEFNERLVVFTSLVQS